MYTSCFSFYIHAGDEDYRAITRDFSFNGVECVQIPIFNDNIVEGPERFFLNLTATLSGFAINSAIVEIADDSKPMQCDQSNYLQAGEGIMQSLASSFVCLPLYFL